jgi:hypothetical protein
VTAHLLAKVGDVVRSHTWGRVELVQEWGGRVSPGGLWAVLRLESQYAGLPEVIVQTNDLELSPE